MSNVTKQSVKIEMTAEDANACDQRDLLEDALFEALDKFEMTEGCDTVNYLKRKFFTIRFDEADADTIAVTVTSSDKRG